MPLATSWATSARNPRSPLQLTTWRRQPIDWLLLADCEGTLGHAAAAENAMQTALRINPRLWGVHKHLADQLRRQGKIKEADWHQLRAVP